MQVHHDQVCDTQSSDDEPNGFRKRYIDTIYGFLRLILSFVIFFEIGRVVCLSVDKPKTDSYLHFQLHGHR